MEEVQQDAIGVDIIVTIVEDGVAVDVSAVTTKQLIFTKPNNVSVTKTAAFTTDGVNGKIEFTSDSGFLDLSGVWSVQGYVVWTGGFNGRSVIQQFQVKPNL